MADKDLLTMTDAEELAADNAADAHITPEEAAATAEAEAAAEAEAKNKLPDIPVSERASITSQADLDAILALHSRWVDAVLDPKAGVTGGRANLSQLDLTPYALQRANLGGANLSGAIMHGMDLGGCNLTAADLRGTDLRAADLRLARLSRARIDGARLAGADMTGATLTGVDLTKAIMHEASVIEEPAEAVESKDDGSPEPAAPVGDDGVTPEASC